MSAEHSDSESAGSIQPITDESDIERLRTILSDKPRDLLLFDLAIQTGLRMKDILSIRVRDLSSVEVGHQIRLGEEPGGLPRAIMMSERIHETLNKYLEAADLAPDDFLFKSPKGPRPLTLSTVSNIINGWFQSADIKGPTGAKSLRKTWEYFAEKRPFIGQERKGYDYSAEVMEPIERLPIQEQIYNKLLEGIAAGKIAPGSKLATGEISKMFKVSPTPVRMALSRLEARGFIVSQKKKAFYVDRLSLQSLNEITTIRLALETLGVELCCKTRSEETIEVLESLIDVYIEADDFDVYQQTNKEFHLTLCRDAGMPILQQMISDLCDRVTPYFVLFTEKANRVIFHQENIHVHRQILEGFKRKDQQMACQWLEADLKQSLSVIRTLFLRRQGRAMEKCKSSDIS